MTRLEQENLLRALRSWLKDHSNPDAPALFFADGYSYSPKEIVAEMAKADPADSSQRIVALFSSSLDEVGLDQLLMCIRRPTDYRYV